jgi:selenocysteine lyase/cysteine desulfurase
LLQNKSPPIPTQHPHPKQQTKTTNQNRGWLDANWYAEVGRRLPPGGHYVDFTGSGLYTNSQLEAATDELRRHVFGNPHCHSPSSLLADEEVRAARARVLAHFSADPAEYAVVFTR